MDKAMQLRVPEVWGGIECTINRVYNEYRDQLHYSGHYLRPNDIIRFSELGLKALRYPVLWEMHERKEGEKIDWRHTSERLNLIKDLGMEPIAGLLHHGSGPAFTDLIDPLFPKKFAAYAQQVAIKFPWLKYYTPVNEPLTTARFSGLYGFWYPHLKSSRTFVQILLNQIKATILAMTAIRKINPDAVLVQTEDLGKTYSTSELQYQADFENERRWLSFDLLNGSVSKSHVLWKYLLSLQPDEKQLTFFAEQDHVPFIMGLNYYITSERYLDHNIHLYPSHLHGGNNKHRYADIEAVRIMLDQPHGLKELLKETWKKYRLPIAITEAHLGCSREEQMRWLMHIWNTCCNALKESIDIRSVTAWSLLGSFDWNSMLTKSALHYETGVFDIRGNNCRPTALADLIKHIATKGACDHPVLSNKGWWEREDRYINIIPHRSTSDCTANSKPVLIIGKNMLTDAFEFTCKRRAIHYQLVNGNSKLNYETAEAMIEKYRPWAIINTYDYGDINKAESFKTLCNTINVNIPAVWARLCKKRSIRFINFSSDMVFSGQKKEPYLEHDVVEPLNVFGRTKSVSEKKVLQHNELALIIRTGPLFSDNSTGFPVFVLNKAKHNCRITAPDDIMISPAYVTDTVDTTLDLLIDNAHGIWHVSNRGCMSWYTFACIIAERCGFSARTVLPVPALQMNWKAPRPKFSVIASEKGVQLPSIESALDRFFDSYNNKTDKCR